MTGNIDINITAYSDALVVLGTAGVLIPIFRRWGLNPVLGYLAAGALLGPLGLGSFINQFHPLYWFTIVNPANVSGIAELGIVFLLFVIGLELSPQRLATMRNLVGGLGGLQVLLSTGVITAAALLMHQGLPQAIILGASLSLSSTAIVLELLSKQNRMSSSLGRATFAILLAQDIAAIPILIFVSIGGSNSGGSVVDSLLKALLQAALAIGIIVVSGHFLLRPLFRLVAAAHSSELFIATVLFVIVATGVIAHQAGLSMALGAFIAGLLLAETEFSKAIQASINPFKGLLLGVFFFTVGMRVDVRELVREPALLIGCAAGLIAIKAIVLTGLARVFRLSWSNSVEAGLLLGPGGEFAFVIIGLATDLNLLSSHLSGLSLAVVSATMATTPLLSSAVRRLRKKIASRRQLDPNLSIRPPRQSGHAIVVGYGRVGKVVCELLRKQKVPFLATDLDPQAVVSDHHQGREVFFGDASDPEFLKACGLQEAAGFIVTINSRDAIDAIIPHVRSARPDIPIISRARDADHARHLYEMGVSEAVPETVESSLQLSEAALMGLGVSPQAAATAVQAMRAEFHREMRTPLQMESETHNSA